MDNFWRKEKEKPIFFFHFLIPLIISFEWIGSLCNIKCPVCKNNSPVRKNYGPVHKNYSPVSKNHEMRHFADKNTYNAAIFFLWPPQKKSMLKSGIMDMFPEKNVSFPSCFICLFVVLSTPLYTRQHGSMSPNFGDTHTLLFIVVCIKSIIIFIYV